MVGQKRKTIQYLDSLNRLLIYLIKNRLILQSQAKKHFNSNITNSRINEIILQLKEEGVDIRRLNLNGKTFYLLK